MTDRGAQVPPQSSEIAALLSRVAVGERAALHTLYHRTSVKLFGICLRILSSREEAEDTLQEIYVSIWHGAGTFRPERGDGMAWLTALARNRAIDRLRARRPLASEPLLLAETISDDRPSASEQLEERQEQGRLALCLDGLSSGDAQLIRTAFFEGATYSDLSRRADTPIGTIKSRIRRALLRLRECLQ